MRFITRSLPAASLLVAALAASLLVPPLQAQVATISEAETVAANWVAFVIHHRDDWGGFPTASVAWTEELKRGDRFLGYHCRVEPRGYVVVSSLKQLSPIHAFGHEGNLQVDSDQETVEFIKRQLEHRLDAIEELVGPIGSATPEDLESALGNDHGSVWEFLGTDPHRFRTDLTQGNLRMDYEEGEELITSRWHQYPPYNDSCPEVPPKNPCVLNRCLVGCTALAAAEILHYWCWPPRGAAPFDDPYNWWDMPRTIHNGSPSHQIDAVAELCSELGAGMSMYYCITEDGCGSYASFRAAKYAYDNYFYYSQASDSLMRVDYPDDDAWFALIKGQHNRNRPIEYGIPGHAIVVDGWMEIQPGPERYVHACPGFPDSAEVGWYLLDEILWSEGVDELMIRNLYPTTVVENPMQGEHRPEQQPLSYWYVDRDNASDGATFTPGCFVQFLPRVTVTCTSPFSGAIRFYGGVGQPTRLLTRGDPTKGIRVDNGALALYGGGGIAFR